MEVQYCCCWDWAGLHTQLELEAVGSTVGVFLHAQDTDPWNISTWASFLEV